MEDSLLLLQTPAPARALITCSAAFPVTQKAGSSIADVNGEKKEDDS